MEECLHPDDYSGTGIYPMWLMNYVYTWLGWPITYMGCSLCIWGHNNCIQPAKGCLTAVLYVLLFFASFCRLCRAQKHFKRYNYDNYWRTRIHTVRKLIFLLFSYHLLSLFSQLWLQIIVRERLCWYPSAWHYMGWRNHRSKTPPPSVLITEVSWLSLCPDKKHICCMWGDYQSLII